MWKSRVSQKSSKKRQEDVTITIAITEWSENELKLKPKRGKRLALRVSNQAACCDVRDKATEKWSSYHSDCYKEGEGYMLIFEDGKSAQFLPGTFEFFTLKRYQEEIGKDYKRIALYLCTEEDYKLSNGEYSSKKEQGMSGDEGEPPQKQMKLDKYLETQVEDDEKLAREMQEFDKEELVEGKTENSKPDGAVVFPDLESETGQFFLVVRRGATLLRILNLWQREAKKMTPEKVLRVHFSGEAGIDSGAIAKEFLKNCVSKMRVQMFPDGAPVDSMYHIHNGNFRACGQIVAASIVTGGPAPGCLEGCVYDMLVSSNIDIQSLSLEKHFTPEERKQVNEIRKNISDHQDTIIEHGYTGPINSDHTEAIIGTIMVSIVNRRLLHLKEFLEGLKCYGLADAMQRNAELFKTLFTRDNDKPVDANYLFSLMHPNYSSEGSSKRLQEAIMDNFQDFLMTLEDERVTGYSEAVAWDDGVDNMRESDLTQSLEEKPQQAYLTAATENAKSGVPLEEQFQQADLTAAGVLGWLTGQRHRPRHGSLTVTGHFDHDCMRRNPRHTLCFPQVGACGKEVTFPVAHMKDSEEFQKNVLLAFCKRQAFGRP